MSREIFEEMLKEIFPKVEQIRQAAKGHCVSGYLHITIGDAGFINIHNDKMDFSGNVNDGEGEISCTWPVKIK